MNASAPSPALDKASARAWTSETTCTRMSRTVEQPLEDAAADEGDQDDQRGDKARGSEGDEQALSALHPAEVTHAGQGERGHGVARQERPAAVRAGVVGERHHRAATKAGPALGLGAGQRGRLEDRAIED